MPRLSSDCIKTSQFPLPLDKPPTFLYNNSVGVKKDMRPSDTSDTLDNPYKVCYDSLRGFYKTLRYPKT